MKQKLRELGAKLQTNKGSILVYTLIVMMIMLSTALSIFAVAVREKKGAGTTAASMQAFAVADSGSEIALQAADKNTAINSLPGATSCNSTTGTVTINVAGGIADITFYSDEVAATALGCGVSAGSAQKVKSVGQFSGTARAVEVAVAVSGTWDDCEFATTTRENLNPKGTQEASFGSFAECPSGYKVVLGGCGYNGVNGWGGGPWKFGSVEGWGCTTSGSVPAYAKCCR